MLRRVLDDDDSELLTERTTSCCGGASYTTRQSSIQMDPGATFDELAAGFLLESGRRLDAVEEALLAIGECAAANTPEAIEDIRRELHTVEGDAVMMGFKAVQERTREIQGIVAAPIPTPAATTPVLNRIDDLRALLHEAVHPAVGEDVRGREGDATGLLLAPESIEALIRLLADSVVLGPRRIDRPRLATRLAAYSRGETASGS